MIFILPMKLQTWNLNHLTTLLKSSLKAKIEDFRWHPENFVIGVDFMLALVLRTFHFPIPMINSQQYLLNILKSWMTNYSWILGQTFRKQRCELCNGSKINDIKLRSDRLPDSLSFQVSSKLSLAVHSQRIATNPQKSSVGLDCSVRRCCGLASMKVRVGSCAPHDLLGDACQLWSTLLNFT